MPAPKRCVESCVQCRQSACNRGDLSLGTAPQGRQLKEQNIRRKEAPPSGPGEPRGELEWPEPGAVGGPARMVLTPAGGSAVHLWQKLRGGLGAGATLKAWERLGSLLAPGRH